MIGGVPTSAQGKLVSGVFTALVEFERELISERTKTSLESAGARGRTGGRQFTMTPAKVRLVMASMGHSETTLQALRDRLAVATTQVGSCPDSKAPCRSECVLLDYQQSACTDTYDTTEGRN